MAEKYRWIEKLSKHPLFQTVLECYHKDNSTTEARNVLAEREGELFVWVPEKSRIFTTNLKNVLFENERADKYQEFLFTKHPLFKVHTLRFSLTGRYLALVGHKGISVIEMPQRWGRFAEYQGGADIVNCRTITVDERFFTVHAKTVALEARWHPSSHTDSHLVVLTSDNMLRIYNILQPEVPEQVINLSDPFSSEVNQSRSTMTSASAFAIALGETSVSFDFAPPIRKCKPRFKNESSSAVEAEPVYPLFILRENADVYYLVFELGNKGFGLESVGPLTMHPATDNNYGLDACSIICLQSQPPVVVMATANGRIYHCIVLESNDESDSAQGDKNESWSDQQLTVSDLTLYVHECVELQRSIAGRDVDESSQASHDSVESLNSCPVQLYRDSASSNQYHCCHPSGVHSIVLPWVRKLESFCIEDGVEGATMFDTDEEAIVYHMVCTTPSTESAPSPVHGLCVINNLILGSSLVCLTDRMECIARPLDLLQRPLAPPSNTEEEEEDEKNYKGIKSPMRHLLSGSFVEHIRKILTRNTSTPLIRAQSTSDLSQEDRLKIFTEAQQILREEYLQRQNRAKVEIEKRVSILRDQKKKQEQDLDNLRRNRDAVRNKAEELADKIEDVISQDIELSDKLENVCQHIETQIPVISKAEGKMREELETIQLRVNFLQDSLDQIRAKHQHKTRRKSSGSSSGSPVISVKQQKNIRSVLKNETDTISDLINQVKDLKLQVGL
ncbi:nucleoporin 88-like [Actinia tenebrosa]|uniref:Nucleoporin 88-like n=1 Tax=Actinia tenebrosa TaxID=6105 RepID=A0A6P8HAV3_ACTTE|nr:nucleoporin 88-like [Actinia tenebrosa]